MKIHLANSNHNSTLALLIPTLAFMLPKNGKGCGGHGRNQVNSKASARHNVSRSLALIQGYMLVLTFAAATCLLAAMLLGVLGAAQPNAAYSPPTSVAVDTAPGYLQKSTRRYEERSDARLW